MKLIVNFILGALVGVVCVAKAEICEHDSDGIRKHEHRLLNVPINEEGAKALADSLKCLLEIHEKADDPDTRYLANAYLRVILGGPLVKKVPGNKKYAEIAKRLETITLRGDQTAEKFAQGDWKFYKLFCEQGDVAYCATMIPDEEKIKKQTPLIAASSMLHLKQAYLILTGEQKQQIAKRIKILHATIPKESKIQRKYIDEIYNQLALDVLVPAG